MHQVSIQDSKLLEILSNLTDTVFGDPDVVKRLDDTSVHPKCALIPDKIGYGHEYLNKALKHKVEEFGHPRCSYGQDTTFLQPHNEYFYELVSRANRRLMSFVGSPLNALFMYYPKDGYIGWHHNGNAPGYNALFTFNTEGNGYFESYHKAKDQYFKLEDNKGWNLRFGYYADQNKDPDNVFWHAAYSGCPRLTIAYVFKHRQMWENLIEQCTDEKLPESLNYIGPS